MSLFWLALYCTVAAATSAYTTAALEHDIDVETYCGMSKPWLFVLGLIGMAWPLFWIAVVVYAAYTTWKNAPR